MTARELDHDKYSAYLNHHLVAADAGVQAFAAAAETWEGTQWEQTFSQLHVELKDSHSRVEGLIESLGYDVSKLRNLVAGVVAATGRKNPLNPTRNRDGIMTQAELDALVGALNAQQMMWETFGVLAEIDPRLETAECQDMVERCQDQVRRVKEVSAATAPDRFTRVPEEAK